MSLSKHDAVINAISNIYRREGKVVYTNPGNQQNTPCNGYYIDVIMKKSVRDDSFWAIEVETDPTVFKYEAEHQWKKYNRAYGGTWYLAVPAHGKQAAVDLIAKFNLNRCAIVTWHEDKNGVYTLKGLPGLG